MDVQEHRGTTFATVDAEGIAVSTVQDALDLVAAAKFDNAADVLILRRAQLSDDAFDLRTGLLGEVLQKFTNYGLRVAFVGDWAGIESRALRDFIYECNQGRAVAFVASEAEAVERMA